MVDNAEIPSEVVTVKKIDETWFEINGPDSFCKELSDFFSFEVENLHHIRRQNPRLKFWDGKIRLYNAKKKLLPQGLLQEAVVWLRDQPVKLRFITPVTTLPTYTWDPAFYAQNVEKAGLTWAEDQLNAITQCIKKRKVLLVSPTASGKSFIIYNIQQFIQKPTLIVVPTVQLTDQMEKDFLHYGFDNDKNSIHKLCYGEPRNFDVHDGDIVVGTWQTLCKLPKEFFEQFEVVIGDEAHEYEAKQVSGVIEQCVNAYYKIGTTGTLRSAKMNRMALIGLFGPVYQAVTTKELMEEGRVSDLKINIVVLKYSKETIKEFWKNRNDYNDELNWLFEHKKRNLFLIKLINVLKNNTLLLFKRKEAHGIPLFEQLKADTKKLCFYVDGDVTRIEREAVRSVFEANDNCVAIASFGTFSRGINIRNLHNLIFASPIKAEITTLQSIGRALRLNSNKSKAILYDIVDDLSIEGKNNAALDHFIARLQAYIAAGFDYEITTIELD